MNKNVVIAIVLGVLIVIAAVQMFQMFSLKSTLSGRTGGAAQVSAPVQSGGGGGGAQLPSNLQNLPDMVGGC